MSPERLEGAMYSFEGDVWSLGVTVVECATGRCPFVKADGTPVAGFWELLNHIKMHDPPSLSTAFGFSPDLCDFVSKWYVVFAYYSQDRLLVIALTSCSLHPHHL